MAERRKFEMKKIKMTVGQAVVKFLNQQYVEMDGKVTPFVDGMFTIFGHGMVVVTISLEVHPYYHPHISFLQNNIK